MGTPEAERKALRQMFTFAGVLAGLALLLVVLMPYATRNSDDGEERSCSVRMVGDQPVVDCYGTYDLFPEVIDLGGTK